MSPVLLLIEDEVLLAQELAHHFAGLGYEVTLCATLADAAGALAPGGCDPWVVLSDMTLPDGNALDLLQARRTLADGQPGVAPSAPEDRITMGEEWIFLTGYGSVRDSVRGLRLGAFEFLEKPVDLPHLDLIVQGAVRSSRAQRRLSAIDAADDARYPVAAFAGRSAPARMTRDLLQRLARVPFSAVLLEGETGTGKGLAARILHHAGPRSGGPLVEINCAALPHELLESELFGHEAGAFSGARQLRRGLIEQADGGTLFLDEIGELAGDLQAKLLKVVEDRRVRRIGGSRETAVDVRVLAASNRDLAGRVAAGAFRSDLYHRLNTFQVTLPPLRNRLDDLQDLVPLFVAEFGALVGRRFPALPAALWPALAAHGWPGNIRELRNVIERCVLLADSGQFPLHLLPFVSSGRAEGSAGQARPAAPILTIRLDGERSLEQIEEDVIRAALAACDGNLQAAARLLRTRRETLRYRVQKYQLRDSGVNHAPR